MQEAVQLRSLGNYRLLASLATGGMARVYLALRAGPAGFNKLLVLKVLRDDSPAGAEDSLRMFWDEARLSAQLVHPNIVHTFEVGEIDHQYFLAMEYLDGQTYRSVFRRALAYGGIPLPEQLRILSETARGLHYAHWLCDFRGQALGVVHRDVSPQNVFLTYDGQVKLLDFGIAKTRDAEHHTQVGVIKGKLDYMAPEQVRGDALDGRADVFSLGAMLYEAISGTRFAGARGLSQVARLNARLVGGETKLRTLVPHVPEALAQIVDHALAVDPAWRFQDAASFADAIDAYLATLPGKPPSAKSLAAYATPLFEAERAAMHKLIEQQIHSVQRGAFLDASGELPRLNPSDARSSSGLFVGELEERSHTGAPAAPLATGRPPSMGGMGGMGGTAARGPGRTVALVLGGALLAGISLGLLQGTATEHVGVAASSSSAQPAASAARESDGQGASAAKASPSAATTLPAAAPPHAAEPQVEAATARVNIELRATPASARVRIDDTPVSSPFAGEFPKSAEEHRIEITAPGYRPFTRTLVFDQSRSMDVALTPLEEAPARRIRRAERSERDEAPAATPAPTPPSATPAAPAAEPAPGEVIPKRRLKIGVIDLEDPYAKPR